MCYASAIRYGTRLRGANCAVAISNFVTSWRIPSPIGRTCGASNMATSATRRARAPARHLADDRSRELNIPLMVVTGRNDPRVPPRRPTRWSPRPRQRQDRLAPDRRE
jgi:hypothetical protein